jgi:hypothetical protein
MNDKSLPRIIYSGSMIANDGRFLWYAIPKNASCSLLRLLEDRARRLADITPGNPRDWMASAVLPSWSFAAVRHPAARVVSVWRDKLVAPPRTENQARILERCPGLSTGMSLSAFIDWLGRTVPQRQYIDKHWRPQHHFISARSGELAVDRLIRCERLDIDLKDIADRIGPIDDLRWINRTSGTGGDLSLSDADHRIIRDVYARDFELLGYE